MKVYRDDSGEKRLIGRAEIPEDTGPAYEVLLFGAASTIKEVYALGVVTTLGAKNSIVTDRGIILATDQRPELLPGWQALDG